MLSPVTAGVALVVALIVFGPKKIPEIANAFGKSLNEFKKGLREADPTDSNVFEVKQPEHRLESPAAPAQLADSSRGENPVKH